MSADDPMLFARWLHQHDTFIIWQNGITSSIFFLLRRAFLPHSNSAFSVIRCNWVKCIKRFWVRVEVGVWRMRAAAPAHTATCCRLSCFGSGCYRNDRITIELVWFGCSFYFHEWHKKRHERTFEPEDLGADCCEQFLLYASPISACRRRCRFLFLLFLCWCCDGVRCHHPSPLHGPRKVPEGSDYNSNTIDTQIWSRCARNTQQLDFSHSPHLRCTVNRCVLHFLSFVSNLAHRHKFGAHLFAYGWVGTTGNRGHP